MNFGNYCELGYFLLGISVNKLIEIFDSNKSNQAVSSRNSLHYFNKKQRKLFQEIVSSAMKIDHETPSTPAINIISLHN